ncbi:hypothetical protein [Haladaptatus sp. NG-WS-4]
MIDLMADTTYTDVVLPALLGGAFVYARFARGSQYGYWQKRTIEVGAVAMCLFVIGAVVSSSLISMVAIGATVLLICTGVLGYVRREQKRSNHN